MQPTRAEAAHNQLPPIHTAAATTTTVATSATALAGSARQLLAGQQR